MSERLAAVAFLAASAAYTVGAAAFPFGTGARPGPGFFPVAVGGFLCAVAAVFTLTAFRRNPAPIERATARAVEAGAGRRVGVTAGALVGFCLLLPWTGYPAVAFLFVAALIKRLGSTGWIVALLCGVFSAAASYYVFDVLLGVPLPRGVLLD